MTKEEFENLVHKFEELAKECEANGVAVIGCLDGTSDEDQKVKSAAGVSGVAKKLCMALLLGVVHNRGMRYVFYLLLSRFDDINEILEQICKDNEDTADN